MIVIKSKIFFVCYVCFFATYWWFNDKCFVYLHKLVE